MEITLNGAKHELPEGCILGRVLDELGVTSAKGIALALNGEVIARENWDVQPLKDKDAVLIVRATQGG